MPMQEHWDEDSPRALLLAKNWRGMMGEADMSRHDWIKRKLEQHNGLAQGLELEDTCLDDEGVPTGGCYNGDYPESWHILCNQRMEYDEHYEARVEEDLRKLDRLTKEQP